MWADGCPVCERSTVGRMEVFRQKESATEMAHVAEVAQSPVPPEAFQRYENKWIAIRGREIVAVADDYDGLRDDPCVRASDLLYRVPPAAIYFYAQAISPGRPGFAETTRKSRTSGCRAT